MIEDIKIVQRYGWKTNDEGVRAWEPIAYTVMVKRNGEWSEIRVEHLNPLEEEE
jgi:hypothetical protein